MTAATFKRGSYPHKKGHTCARPLQIEPERIWRVRPVEPDCHLEIRCVADVENVVRVEDEEGIASRIKVGHLSGSGEPADGVVFADEGVSQRSETMTPAVDWV